MFPDRYFPGDNTILLRTVVDRHTRIAYNFVDVIHIYIVALLSPREPIRIRLEKTRNCNDVEETDSDDYE